MHNLAAWGMVMKGLARRSLLHLNDPSIGSLPDTVVVTDEHHLIREWAARHMAEPATGEATASGPATVTVQDLGAGIRFNFPGVARFRPITWTEWFENLSTYDLVFVFEHEAQGQPPNSTYHLVPRHVLAPHLCPAEDGRPM